MKNLLSHITIILFVGFNSLTNAQWFPQNNPSQNNSLNDIFVFDENSAIVVGVAGTVLKTLDGGENWLNIPHDSTDWPNSVFFLNDSIAWIVGFGNGMGEGSIQKTTNGGNNWISQYNGGWWEVFYSVHFVNEDKGWAVGVYSGDGPPHGIMYKTTDGGINWILQNPGIYPGLWSSIFFINIDTGWVVGGGGFGGNKIAKTTDSGETWLIQLSDVNGWLSDVHFINENTGWTVGYGGSIFKTTDGGENWINQPSGVTNILYSVQFEKQSTGWAVGEYGSILNTSDGGENWINQPSGTTNDLYSVNFANESAGWVVGESGTILKTKNGGDPIPVELTSFTASAQFGYVELKWTTATELNNLGFEIQRSTVTSEFVTIGFVEGNGTTTEEHYYGFKDKDVSGFLRYRLKQIDYDGAFGYSNEIEADAAPLSFSLEQNYPNPFNPITTIKFNLPEKEFVSLKVYDVIGKETAILLNEEKPAGSHSIEFNASKLASGTYIYKLQAGSNVEVQKMLLLK